MGRKKTESAKEKKKWKMREPESAADLPDYLKHATIEFHYRRGKEATEISQITGIRIGTVRKCINRYHETGSGGKNARGGRPSTASTRANVIRVRRIMWQNPETSITEIARRLGISRVSCYHLCFVISWVLADCGAHCGESESPFLSHGSRAVPHASSDA